MPEITDTNGKYKITPEGKYKFTVSIPPAKKLSKEGKPYYKFVFEYLNEEKTIETHEQFFLPWMLGDLLRACQCKEIKPGVFSWDKEDVVGKTIDAEIIHEINKKDPTKTMVNMIKIKESEKEEIPF